MSEIRGREGNERQRGDGEEATSRNRDDGKPEGSSRRSPVAASWSSFAESGSTTVTIDGEAGSTQCLATNLRRIDSSSSPVQFETGASRRVDRNSTFPTRVQMKDTKWTRIPLAPCIQLSKVQLLTTTGSSSTSSDGLDTPSRDQHALSQPCHLVCLIRMLQSMAAGLG